MTSSYQKEVQEENRNKFASIFQVQFVVRPFVLITQKHHFENIFQSVNNFDP